MAFESIDTSPSGDEESQIRTSFESKVLDPWVNQRESWEGKGQWIEDGQSGNLRYVNPAFEAALAQRQGEVLELKQQLHQAELELSQAIGKPDHQEKLEKYRSLAATLLALVMPDDPRKPMPPMGSA